MSSGSNKRRAPASPMGPPAKRAKRTTALETKLQELQETVWGLSDIWEDFDPGKFMGEMRRMRTRVDALDPNTIEKFIATGECNAILRNLDYLDRSLLTTPSMGSQQLDVGDLYQGMRSDMIGYVGRVRGCLQALVAQAQVKPTPSEFADGKIWGVCQEKANPILCLRPAHRRGWPIPLMHRAFCDFTRHFHEPCLDKHTADYLSMADALCETMPSAFDSEVARRQAFEKIFDSLDSGLTSHLEYHLPANDSNSKVKESGGRPDVAKSIPYNGSSLILMLEEFKNEDGGIYMQICRTYEVLCGDPKVERLVKFGNPMFLLCVLGPYLMVCGAVKREDVHVEPLTPFLPMLPGYGIEGRPMQLAHCLRALKQGLDALQKFWRDEGVTGGANEESMIDRPQRQHPDCPDDDLLSFDHWKGTFEEPMHRNKFPAKAPSFLATLRKAGTEVQVVVKFVYKYSGTYGTATHEYLYGLGLAPRLYSVVDLHRGLVMVVMEYLAFQEGIGGWVELDSFRKRLGDMEGAVREKLQKIVNYLQGEKMVHADLRPKNIMIQVDEQRRIKIDGGEPVLSLIDFDWAGMVGEVRYPPFLNPDITWPTGAAAYEVVGRNDDSILLENWWGAFVEPAGSS